MGEIDAEMSAEILTEMVRRDGEVVYSYSWDGGAPGASGSHRVYEFEDHYWSSQDGDLSGPFSSLEKAVGEIPAITDGVTSLDFTGEETDEVVKKLEVDAKPGHEVQINGSWFRVTEARELEPIENS